MLSSNKSTFIQLCILYRQDPFCSKLVVFFNFETSIWCLGPLKSPKGIHFVDIDLDMGDKGVKSQFTIISFIASF